MLNSPSGRQVLGLHLVNEVDAPHLDESVDPAFLFGNQFDNLPSVWLQLHLIGEFHRLQFVAHLEHFSSEVLRPFHWLEEVPNLLA